MEAVHTKLIDNVANAGANITHTKMEYCNYPFGMVHVPRGTAIC